MNLEEATKSAYVAGGFIEWEKQSLEVKKQWYTQIHAAFLSNIILAAQCLQKQMAVAMQDRRDARPVEDEFPELEFFLDAMRFEMRREGRRKKRNWQNDTPLSLAVRTVEEAAELLTAANAGDPDLEGVVNEAIDVALMAFMVAERARPASFKPEPKKTMQQALEELARTRGP